MQTQLLARDFGLAIERVVVGDRVFLIEADDGPVLLHMHVVVQVAAVADVFVLRPGALDAVGHPRQAFRLADSSLKSKRRQLPRAAVRAGVAVAMIGGMPWRQRLRLAGPGAGRQRARDGRLACCTG